MAWRLDIKRIDELSYVDSTCKRNFLFFEKTRCEARSGSKRL